MKKTKEFRKPTVLETPPVAAPFKLNSSYIETKRVMTVRDEYEVIKILIEQAKDRGLTAANVKDIADKVAEYINNNAVL